MTLPGLNLTSPEQLIAYESGQVPILWPCILFVIYLIIAVGGYMTQQRKVSRANFAIWSAIAGLIVTTGAFVLFFIPGAMNIETLSICVTVTIVSAFWALWDSRGD